MTTLTGDTIDLPASAITRAQTLIGAVRDHDPEAVAELLRGLQRRDAALVVALAAMVPVDQSPTELLAWNDRKRPARLVNAPRTLAPHGTHAAFNRHRKNGAEPCPACWDGERDYQRGRKRQARGAA